PRGRLLSPTTIAAAKRVAGSSLLSAVRISASLFLAVLWIRLLSFDWVTRARPSSGGRQPPGPQPARPSWGQLPTRDNVKTIGQRDLLITVSMNGLLKKGAGLWLLVPPPGPVCRIGRGQMVPF